jgi:hypothetical protein
MLHIIQNTTIVNDIFLLENLSVNCILLERETNLTKKRAKKQQTGCRKYNSASYFCFKKTFFRGTNLFPEEGFCVYR